MLVSLDGLASSSGEVSACSGCQQEAKVALLIYCVCCGASRCTSCIRAIYPSRDRIGVCRQCPFPPPDPELPGSLSSLGSTELHCGRCRLPFSKIFSKQLEMQESMALLDPLRQASDGKSVVSKTEFETSAFFCSSCGVPICVSCMSDSFSGGFLYCYQCFPRPLRWTHEGIPHLIDESLLRALYTGTATISVSTDVPNPSLDLLMPELSKYRKLFGKEFLGKGAQATVYKCETEDHEMVVSKEMTFSSKKDFETQRRQSERMQQLSHTHLIRYLDVISDPEKLSVHIVLPYYSKGDLAHLIFHHQGPVPVFKLCSLVLQLTTALAYLHSQSPPLVHCDVKPENILLLNNEEQVLLTDLDMCREEEKLELVRVGRRKNGKDGDYTSEYSAPEVRKGLARTPKADVFSLGIVTYALAALPSEIFLEHNGNVRLLSDDTWAKDIVIFERLIRSAIRARCSTYPNTLVDLILSMLRFDPAERPTSMEVESRLSEIMLGLL